MKYTEVAWERPSQENMCTLEREKVKKYGESYIMSNFVIFTLHRVSLWWSTQVHGLAGHVGCMGKVRNIYKILVKNPKRNSLLGRRKGK
jgi:hypothetical protein